MYCDNQPDSNLEGLKPRKNVCPGNLSSISNEPYIENLINS